MEEKVYTMCHPRKELYFHLPFSIAIAFGAHNHNELDTKWNVILFNVYQPTECSRTHLVTLPFLCGMFNFVHQAENTLRKCIVLFKLWSLFYDHCRGELGKEEIKDKTEMLVNRCEPSNETSKLQYFQHFSWVDMTTLETIFLSWNNPDK